jgi:hypothetical protein
MSVKYLEVIMDSRLIWREHVDIKVRNAQNLLRACRRAVIRPPVSFASLVCWPGFQTASAKKKLSRIQRLACLGITGAVRTTPTPAMKANICLSPLDLVVQSEARMAAHSL